MTTRATHRHRETFALIPVLLTALVACGDNAGMTEPDAGPVTSNPGPRFTITASNPAGTYNGIEYVEHECRFQGTRPDGVEYDMNCWLIAPSSVADSTGVVLLDIFNSVNLEIFGELRVSFARLGKDFLLDNGFMYAGIRWDKTAIAADKRQSPERAPDVITPAAASKSIGYNILIDFSRALRSNRDIAAVMGEVDTLISYGYSQSGAIQRRLLIENRDLFDGSLVGGAGARFLAMESNIIGDRNEFFFDRRAPSVDAGKIMQLDSESDLLVIESADTRTGPESTYRKYEIVGGSHLKRAVCQAVGLPDAATANPLDWDPISRALLLALRDWVVDDEDPPDARLIDNVGIIIRRDSNGNALGGVRLPEIAAGRGQYVGFDINHPLDEDECDLTQPRRCPDEFRRVCGTFVDKLCDNYSDLADYVTAVTTAADQLVTDRFLLTADRDAIVQAAQDLVDSTICPARP